MDKGYILSKIRDVAASNGGKTPSAKMFETTTGIRQTVWMGKYWARWGDAVSDAGLRPNVRQAAYTNEYLIDKIIELVRDLRKFPTRAEIRLKQREDKSFPSTTAIARHLGSMSGLPTVVKSYCEIKSGLEDVIQVCEPHIELRALPQQITGQDGYVYLLKSGKFYKIGMTNNPDRRQYEIGIQLPEELHHIHSIETDDPSGIEAYWHNRFRDKRQKGEWFDLNTNDIRIFRRRKFM